MCRLRASQASVSKVTQQNDQSKDRSLRISSSGITGKEQILHVIVQPLSLLAFSQWCSEVYWFYLEIHSAKIGLDNVLGLWNSGLNKIKEITARHWTHTCSGAPSPCAPGGPAKPCTQGPKPWGQASHVAEEENPALLSQTSAARRGWVAARRLTPEAQPCEEDSSSGSASSLRIPLTFPSWACLPNSGDPSTSVPLASEGHWCAVWKHEGDSHVNTKQPSLKSL